MVAASLFAADDVDWCRENDSTSLDRNVQIAIRSRSVFDGIVDTMVEYYRGV